MRKDINSAKFQGMFFRKVVLAFLFGIIAINCAAQAPLKYSDGVKSFHLHDFMELLGDEACAVGEEEVLSRKDFLPYNQLEDRSKFNCFWVRFEIDNPSPKPIKLYLNTVYSDSVEVFIKNGNTLELSDLSGYLVPKKPHKLNPYRVSLSEINLPAAAKTTYYLHFYSSSQGARFFHSLSFSLGFDLFSYEGVQSTFFDLRDIAFLFAGCLLIMFFFNLMMAFKSEDKVYFWLAFYNLVFCLNSMNAYAYGVSSGLLENPLITLILHFNIPILLILVYGQFAVHFLEIKEILPKITRIISSLSFSVLLAPVLFLLGLTDIAVSFVAVVASAGLGLIFYSVFKKYQVKHKLSSANYFVIGSMLTALFFLNYLSAIIFEERDFYFNEFLVIFSAVIELFIFTYASVQKFVSAQKEVATLELKKRALLDEQAEIKEQLVEKNKSLVAKASAELARNQKQNEVLALLEGLSPAPDSESKSKLKKAIAKIKKLSYDESFEEDFLIHFNGVHVGWSDRLLAKHPDLSINNIRLCSYLKMNFTSLEIAQLQGVEKSSVNQARYRLRKKMNLDNETDLIAYLNAL